MHRFACAQCHMPMTSLQGLGATEICTNCKTPQPVPGDATLLTPEEERRLAASGALRPASKPVESPLHFAGAVHLEVLNYLALFIGWVVIIGGVWFGVYSFREIRWDYRDEWGGMIYPILGGALPTSWGIALLFLRHVVMMRSHRHAATAGH